MVHTFQCLGVRIAVDVNSGAVHVLDELTHDLLTALAEREENGESLAGELPAALTAALPHLEAALRQQITAEQGASAANNLLGFI